MSINSSLVKLADKIDASNKSSIQPDYKNPNNSIEKSIERIADNYESGGGGGGGVLNLHMDRQTRALDKTWAEINAAYGSTIIFLYGTSLLIGVEEDMAGYFVYFADFYDAPTVTKITYKADTADGYPVAQI